MQGQYGAPILRGVVRVPRIEDSGDVRFISGYDAETGLFHDRSPNFIIPSNPSLDDARRAVEALLLPFSKYSFEDVVLGRAMLLAAIFTAIERPFLAVAPVFLIRSSMPGTGKGLIVRSLVRLAFGTSPTLITWGGSGEEFEKRLAALLLRAPGALSIDNANGVEIEGDLLESVVTEGGADIRPLGRSEVVKVRNRSLITITGNNPNITGDMARRTLALEILPGSADPERKLFPFNPEQKIKQHRAALLRAAFLAMRAYRQAGMPPSGLPGVGSFDDWTRRVRDLVFWLLNCDVSDGFRRNKADDPRRQADACLLAALSHHFGSAPFTSAEAVAVHNRCSDTRQFVQTPPTATEKQLTDAVDAVLGVRNVTAKAFGHWARRLKKAHLAGYILETYLDPATNANVCVVTPVSQ